MSITLADQYYLKALDTYNYDLGESIEALQYALSYDEEHAPSLCLMGRVYMDFLKDYDQARHYFEQALLAKSNYIETYRYYSLLLIWIGDLRRANIIIYKAKKIPGISKELIFHRTSLLYESQGRIDLALMELKKAKLLSSTNPKFRYFKDEIARIKRKMKKHRRKTTQKQEKAKI